MFNIIRQNAAGSASVLIRLAEVLGAVADCERDPERVGTLRRMGDLIVGDARRTIGITADLPICWPATTILSWAAKGDHVEPASNHKR